MQQQNKGFTLVELAVVIVIIGLIIGAVIKGQELIKNARVNSVITQVDAFRSAFTSFQGTYGALPGDFAQAQARIPGCQAAGTNCANGDGNSFIATTNAGNSAGTNAGENRMAFQHLAYANLITGVIPGATASANVFNENWPSARTGGGFTILHTSVGTPAQTGHWLRLQASTPNNGPSNATGTGALTPGEAAIIDRRLDDGNALTGTVRAGGFAANCTPASGQYNEQTSSKDCNLFFLIQ